MRGKEVKPLHSLKKHELAGGLTPIARLPFLISSDEQWEYVLCMASFILLKMQFKFNQL